MGMERIRFASIVVTGLLAAMLTPGAVWGQSKTFSIGKGTPAQQLAQVESVTDLETFTGRTDKLTGWITFDPVRRTGSGTVLVDLASLDTGIPLRNDHMRDKGWLDTKRFPEAKFEVTEVRAQKGENYRVTGNFTLRGVSRKITTNATVKHLKESKTTQNAGFKGDVLQVKSSFKIRLSDYGIKVSGPATGKVAPNVTISVTIYAQSGL